MKRTSKKCNPLFTMRMDDATRQKLINLAGNEVYRYNKSALIISLIEAEYLKTIKSHGK